MKKFALSVALAISILILPSASQAYLLDGVQKFNGHYYKVFDYGMTWNDAKKFCENLGGHLVTITSQDEQDFLNRLLTNNENKNFYWIGGYKDNISHNWRWITNEQFYYTHWAKDMPNNADGKETAMFVRKISDLNWEWDDLSPDGNYNPMKFYRTKNSGLICEWDYPNSVKVRY